MHEQVTGDPRLSAIIRPWRSIPFIARAPGEDVGRCLAAAALSDSDPDVCEAMGTAAKTRKENALWEEPLTHSLFYIPMK